MRALAAGAPLLLLLATCARFGAEDESVTSLDGGAPAPRDGGVTEPDGGDASPVTLGAAYEQIVLGDGPMAYWRCRGVADGTMPSATVGGPEATVSDAGPLVRAGGLFDESGGECVFDGSQGEIVVSAGVPFLAATSYSLEAWVYFESAADDFFRHVFQHLTNDTPQRAYGLFHHNEPGGDSLVTEEFLDEHNKRFYAVPALGRWHHVVMTTGSDQQSRGPDLWVDGALQRPAQQTRDMTAPPPYSQPFSWGSKHADRDPPIRGRMTEVAVYDKVLGLDRIMAHWALGRQGLSQ